MFITEGYFQLYKSKHQATFIHERDILVDSDTIQVDEIHLKNIIIPLLNKKQKHKEEENFWPIRLKLIIF